MTATLEHVDATDVAETATSSLIHTIAARCAGVDDTRMAIAMAVDAVAVGFLEHPDVYADAWMVQPTIRRSVATVVQLLHPNPIARQLIPAVIPALVEQVTQGLAERLRSGERSSPAEAAEMAAGVSERILGDLR